MASVIELQSREDADAMLDASFESPVALLKHSVACPISARGQMQFVGLSSEGDPALYAVVVQYARDVSAYLADRLGVHHETPQVLILKDGQALSVFNHYRIQTGDLREATRAAQSA